MDMKCDFCPEHNVNEEERDRQCVQGYKLYVWGRQFYRLNRKRNQERSRKNERKTGACAVSFDRRPLQCYQIKASEWSDAHTHARVCTHTHTDTLSLFPLPLFSLVCFQSRDELLADRTGPLGSCYRPPQQRDWKALIAVLRSPQSRENHSLSVTGSLTWKKSEGGSKKREWKAG